MNRQWRPPLREKIPLARRVQACSIVAIRSVTPGIIQGFLDFFEPTDASPASSVALPRTISAALPPSYARAGDDTAAKPDLVFERSVRAERYRLTLRKDGVAVATIPPRGNEREARAFVEQHRDWLERARARQGLKPRAAPVWTPGTHVLWRGELTEIRKAVEGERPSVCLAADVFRVPNFDIDLRPTLEAHFLRKAKIELTARTWELSAETAMGIKEVMVRNQRTRWGSCTTGGVISLNWRLIQAPESVRDYVIYHELMHLKEMNHSDRFWRRVEEVCPPWREAEAWLKRNGSMLGL